MTKVKKEYIPGIYEVVLLVDSNEYIFKNLELTAKEAAKLFKDMKLLNCNIKKINFIK